MTDILTYNQDYVVFDIETTGFSASKNKITEIGAVKITNGKITDVFSELINPQTYIHWKITEITGITDDMVRNKKTIDDVLPRFLDFCKGSILVAHNASFDVSFIKQNAENLHLEFSNEILDTLAFSRKLLPHLENHRLQTVAEAFGIKLLRAHRAKDDALATAKIFLNFENMLTSKR